ncbi:MAG: hypothetical protein AAGH99_15045 [Planctomycetota bacterium]
MRSRLSISAHVSALIIALCLSAATGCTTYPTAAELGPDRALAVTVEQYNQGFFDGQLLSAGIRAGNSLGDIPGLAGDAWRLGRDDQINSHPCRTEPQLRDWLSQQP